MSPVDGRETAGRAGVPERLALAVVVLAVLTVGARICLGPQERIAFLFYDDAYYYFGVARHLAAGHGSTFDGIHATNGYQPLWCWLLVPLFRIVSDPGIAVRIIAALWFAIAAAVPVAIWWMLRPRTGGVGAVTAAALFSLQPFLGLGLARPNGLETPLYALVLALALEAYARLASRVGSSDGPPGVARVAGFGLAAGAVMLARLDAGFLAVAAAALLGARIASRWGARAAFGRVAALCLATAVVGGPFLAWNAVRFGDPLPVAGRVLSWEARVECAELGGTFAPRCLLRRATYGARDVPLLIGRGAVGEGPLEHRVARTGTPGGVVLLGLALAVVAVGLGRRARQGPWLTDPLTLLAGFAGLHYAAYAGWIWTPGESWYRMYYFMPEVLLLSCAAGAAVGPPLERFPRRALLRRALLGAGLLLLVAGLLGRSSVVLARYAAEPGPVADRHIYGWVRQRLPRDAVLGARDAGKLGFFSGHPVVNLDGLINDDRLLRALWDDRVADYVCDSTIRYLFYDRPWLEGFDPTRPDAPPRSRAGSGEMLYRLHHLPGCSIREIPGATPDWVVVEVLRGNRAP